MATLSTGGRITQEVLKAELERLRIAWSAPEAESDQDAILRAVLGPKALEQLDLFDRAQLAFVLGVCRQSNTLSEAGRKLFGVTREKRTVQNDADRLGKYLARFGLNWQDCQA